jgi:hypothetical protein
MKKTRISLILLVVLAFSALPLSLFVFAKAEPVRTLPDYEPKELGPEFRESEFGIDFGYFNLPSEASVKSSYTAKTWMTLNSYTGYYVFTNYYLMGESDNTQVWVQQDMSWPAGDPRSTPVVTQEDVDFLLNEFDTVIYPRDTEYFGVPDAHDGTYSLLEAWGYVPPGYYADAEGRDVILISNIIDDAYYDPLYPAYIVGFYSPSFEGYFDRNIISIDCYNYTLRLGEGDPTQPDVNRPYVYDGTIAHEYQHLIHDDYYPEDESYMNEACSLYAEPLCLSDQPGFELDVGQIEWFLQTPDNSLTKWGDQYDLNILADYGSSFLWGIYLEEQYGPNFLSQYVQGSLYGLTTDPEDRISELIPGNKGFDDVYRDWRIANLLDTKIGSSTKYNYKMVELGEIKLESIDKYGCYTGSGFGSTITHTSKKYPTGWDTGITTMNPYGSDYIGFDFDTRGINAIFFNGEDYSTVESWDSVTYPGYWWSGYGDLADRVIYGEVEVGTGDQILYLDSLWDLEDYWDFGFVQVSTDDGDTWTSLPDMDEYTTSDHDSNAHPDIIANLPGITSWVNDFTILRYDLSAYSGQNVLVGFRFMTDWATFYEGWFIANAWYGSSDILDPEAIEIALMEWTRGPEVDYLVTIVEKFEHKGKVTYSFHDMWIKDDLTELGLAFAAISKWENIILIVSPMMEKGFTDYSFCAYPVFKGCGR